MSATILETILKKKREEVSALKRSRIPAPSTRTPRSLSRAITLPGTTAVIAEVKKASPSRGVIRKEFDPVAIARMYEEGGAAALSVLTDAPFFQGHRDYYLKARAVVGLPVLRKDFIIDPVQIMESAAMDADAVLLIVAALSDMQLAELMAAAREEMIETLVEVHDKGEWERALKAGATLVGINNRNLKDFSVSLETTCSLASLCPPEVTLVSESGIGGAVDVRLLREAGVHAVLVGESLMRRTDFTVLLRELVNAGKD